MGDNKKKWLWISLGIVAGILVLGYIGTALYFMSHFLPNTKVNGKDFSYAKEEDVADYLKSEVKKYELKITEHAGLSDSITGKEISVEYKENGASSPFCCGRQHGREREKDCPSRQVRIMMGMH